jgi:hypothetical protein
MRKKNAAQSLATCGESGRKGRYCLRTLFFVDAEHIRSNLMPVDFVGDGLLDRQHGRMLRRNLTCLDPSGDGLRFLTANARQLSLRRRLKQFDDALDDIHGAQCKHTVYSSVNNLFS